jgi:hypothetical protein
MATCAGCGRRFEPPDDPRSALEESIMRCRWRLDERVSLGRRFYGYAPQAAGLCQACREDFVASKMKEWLALDGL